MFKDCLNRDVHEDPIILYLEELNIQKGKDESVVFWLDDVENTYCNYELKYLTTNDEDLYEEYKQKI